MKYLTMKPTGPLLLLAFLIGLAACSADDPGNVSIDPADAAGTSDPVVAIGNSLTAGYANSGLSMQGQLQGYANLVANQFLAGISDAAVTVVPGLPPMAISMPLVAGGIGGESGKGPLYVTPAGEITRDDLTVPVEDMLIAASLLQPYGNLGVPGALSFDVTLRTDATPPNGFPVPPNPFFDIVLRNSFLPFNEGEPLSEVTANGTQLGQFLQISAAASSSTALAMLWIGNNDILGPASMGSSEVNPAAVFASFLTPILDEIDRTGVPMVAIANIPTITTAPFFTTVAGLLALGGASPAILNTEETDVMLITLSWIGEVFVNGEVNPEYLSGGAKTLPASATLTTAEVGALAAVNTEYNQVIADEAAARGYALVDAAALLAGLPVDPGDPDFGVLNAVFAFSAAGQNTASVAGLDGVHPSEKGYAAVANAFIEAINGQYGPVLTALRGGPMDTIDVSKVVNRLGFEQLGAGRRIQGFSVSAEGRRGLEQVVPGLH